MRCKLCGGILYFLGQLGILCWFRCRNCGMEWSKNANECDNFEEVCCEED